MKSLSMVALAFPMVLASQEPNLTLGLAFASGDTVRAQQRQLAVYISADMEGIAGLSSGSLKPYGMMQGLDSSFSAVLFVGYHGKARSLGGFAAHTGSGIVADLRINGVSVGEGGMNTLFAAWYGVPVAFISGDSLAVAQQRSLVPAVVGVTVKTGIWDRAVTTLSPDSAQAAIQRGVERALRATLPRPPGVTRPVAVELEYSTAIHAEVAEGIPGIRRVGYSTVGFTTPEYPAAYRMIRVLYRHLQP